MDTAETIGISDTLSVRLWAFVRQPAGQPTFSHFDVERTNRRLDLTVWAQVDLWIGSGPMPPTDLSVLYGDAYYAPPPFSAGAFEVVVRQPDGAAITDTVLVTATPE